MPQEDIFPISPVWTLRHMFYTLIGIPPGLLFLGLFWFTASSGGNWAKAVGYLVFFFGITIISLPINFILNILKLKNFHYILDKENVIIKEGIIQKQNRTINYSAIQTVSVQQGLFEKLAKIATVQIENASQGGGQYSVLTRKQQSAVDGGLGSFINMVIIPGLRIDDAQALKNMLLEKIKTTETVELGL